MLHTSDADHVINVDEQNVVEGVKRVNGDKGFDCVIECSGALLHWRRAITHQKVKSADWRRAEDYNARRKS